MDNKKRVLLSLYPGEIQKIRAYLRGQQTQYFGDTLSEYTPKNTGDTNNTTEEDAQNDH